MDRRQLLGSAAALLASQALSGPLGARGSKRPPNFIVILCDDLGYGDIEPTGGRRIPTPNLNKLAAQGLTFTDYYSPANVCTPSRAGLLTGRYPVRTGLGYQVIMQNDTRVLPQSEVTIAQALKPAGYVSGLFGKWHLGHTGDHWTPIAHGFDYFFGIPYSHDMAPLPLYTIDGDGPVREEKPDLPQLQQRFYAEAERFIERNASRPFFVELALSAPHLPEYPNNAFRGRAAVGSYGDVVEEIDDIVGRLLAKLKASKLDRDTVILFTSDNGPWFEGSAGGLRQRKGGGGYDGGYRVPLIAWAPGLIPAGRRTDAIAMGIDFLPTLCGLAGASLPQVELDGRDLAPVLRGSATRTTHDELLLFNNEDLVGIRTQRWKYVAFDYYRGHLISTDAKYPQLYDIAADPSESYSVADRYPEVLADMRARFAAARARFAGFKKGVPEVFRDFTPPGLVQPD
jgi:uncharacterized sulfatase